jgi:hypothetical protein
MGRRTPGRHPYDTAAAFAMLTDLNEPGLAG